MGEDMLHSKTEKGFCGTYVHRNTSNVIIGKSTPNPVFPKEYFHYDVDGRLVGKSTPDFGGGYVRYDNNSIVGKSVKNPLGGYVHYDLEGRIVGKSVPSFGGCYLNYDNND